MVLHCRPRCAQILCNLSRSPEPVLRGAAAVEAISGCRVPNFGAVIQRTRLVRVFQSAGLAMTTICAPAGYGKSVLASQFADCGAFDDVLWVSLRDADLRTEDALSQVASAITSMGMIGATAAQRKSPLASGSRAGASLCLRDEMRLLKGRSVCLVLDACGRLEHLDAVRELLSILLECTAASSRVIVTCRSIADEVDVPEPHLIWVVDEEDLRFSEAEVAELVALSSGVENATSATAQLLERFKGHPALTSLMCRHVGLDSESVVPRDLVWYTRRIVAQLPVEALEMYYAAALLREGTALELTSGVAPIDSDVDWGLAQITAPLFTCLQATAECAATFRLHSVLCDEVVRDLPSRLGEVAAAQVRQRVLSHLWGVGDFGRLQAVMVTACPENELSSWCELAGADILRASGYAAVTQCLSGVSPGVLTASPKLMIVSAMALREQERFEEAGTHAALAGRLADAMGDWHSEVAAALLQARVALDTGRPERAYRAVRQLDGQPRNRLSASQECLVQAYLSVADAQAGHITAASDRATRVTELLDSMDARSQESVLALHCVASVEGPCRGRWDRALALMMAPSGEKAASPLTRVLFRANLAAAMLEMGVLDEALVLVNEVLPELGKAGLEHLVAYTLGTRASIGYAIGEYAAARADYERAEHLMCGQGDSFGRAGERGREAVARRASGRGEESLELAESASALLQGTGADWQLMSSTSETEIAASLLSLGDAWGARRIAAEVRGALDGSGALANLLRVDLVLAEIERVEGAIPAAVSRLGSHAEYILTGSANWLIAMYVRAFPGLLGLLASAVGAESLPLRMLRMVPTETIDRAVEYTSSFVRQGDGAVVRNRAANSEVMAAEIAAPPLPQVCQVQLFGGLNVSTALGTVDDTKWRKRKARLLFAMLVVRQGQDLPRDVIMEQLWPDMDEEHAKRNFYVTWSTMKRALACGAAPSNASHLVQCSGGVCRLARAVRSDLDEFDESLARLRAAAVERNDAAVLSAARDLLRIYRGELLPGDIYEEWFRDVRERTKHDFCDSMMTGAHVVEARNEFDAALLFLRRASAADPWREDVYQATMRCQIGSGQRSRAIETYLSCQSRLTEDLGIDPSTETTRLYQAVLAMEECSA
jgi:DNA-binding SARP family transcriptional activator/ATP/maltotriose-dependent transcriptional regulator MalT